MDTMWTLIAGMLVFFMNLGFASVESGLCRAKNTVTILAKNFVVFAAASIAFLGLKVCGSWEAPTIARRRAMPIKASIPR
jgi:ammonia channel protein AmtB